MARSQWKIARIFLWWGCAVASLIALLQGSGSLARLGVMGLVACGSTGICLAIFEHGWHRAPHWLGAPFRAIFFLVLAWAPLSILGWIVWPNLPHPQPAAPASPQAAQPAPPGELSPEDIAALVAALKNVEGAKAQREPGSNAPTVGDGFIQFESKTFAVQSEAERERLLSGQLSPGETVWVHYVTANRGGRPVMDVQSWGLVLALDPAKNSSERLRSVMLKTAKDSYKKYKGAGGELGAGLSQYNEVGSLPLTEAQLADLKDGKEMLFLLVCGAWTSEDGKEFYWSHVEWTNWPQAPFANSVWHN